MAFAMVYKFSEAIDRKGKDPDLPAKESDRSSDPDTREKQEKALARNSVAMANLTVAMVTESAMSIIYRARTDDWPGGLAFNVVTALFEKFAPHDVIAKVELRRLLSGVKMKQKESPATIFEQISKIENRFGTTKIDDDDLIPAALTAAPKEYAGVIAAEQVRNPSNFGLESLEKAMTIYHRQKYGKTNDDSTNADEGDELVLSAFGGTCYNCGEKGHRKHECPNPKKRRDQPKFSKKCRHCGKTGHRETSCWVKFPEKAPKFARGKRNETAATAITGSGSDNDQEFLLMAAETPVKAEKMPWCEMCSDVGHKQQYCYGVQVPAGSCQVIHEGDEDGDHKDTIAGDDASSSGSHDHNDDHKDTVAGDDASSSGSFGELVLMALKMKFPFVAELLKDPNIWIGDTGATNHVKNNRMGLINLVEDSSGITMGNNEVEKSTESGDLPCVACDKEGSQLDRIRMTAVSVVPTSGFNLFSISRCLKEGWKLSGTAEALILSKGRMTLKFDIVIPTEKGVIFAIYLQPRGEMANVSAVVPKTVEKAHALLGHPNVDDVRKTAKHLGWELSKSSSGPCASCTTAKAKQKNLPKSQVQETTKDYDRGYLDLSSYKTPDGIPNPTKPYWRMIVREAT